jgi:hypothetical protein
VTPNDKRGRVTPKESHRYTPKQTNKQGPSPMIVPILMGTFFLVGCAIIILNYFNGAPLLPGDTSNANLLLGLAFITAGFITATKWR